MTVELAVITGASRGLGRAMTLHLAERGTNVIGTYRSRRDLTTEVERLAKERGGSAVFVPFDTADDPGAFAARVRQAAEASYGRSDVDALVHNAGAGVHVPFAETPAEVVDAMLHQHARTPYLLTQALLPTIRDGGRILFVSSGMARFTLPGYSAYAMAKGAVEVLTRYVARELGDRQIRVNCVAPGAIETDFGGGVVRDVRDLNEHVASQTALGRAGLPDDIGAAVAAILSDDMAWANGTRIEVSGGQNL